MGMAYDCRPSMVAHCHAWRNILVEVADDAPLDAADDVAVVMAYLK